MEELPLLKIQLNGKLSNLIPPLRGVFSLGSIFKSCLYEQIFAFEYEMAQTGWCFLFVVHLQYSRDEH